MYMLVSCLLDFRITLYIFIIGDVLCAVDNYGNPGPLHRPNLLRGQGEPTWRNIWTTLSPPTTPAPRKLSVFDTIRAAAEASKRLYGSSTYQQTPVFPESAPTVASRGNAKAIQAPERKTSHQQEYVSPTAETIFNTKSGAVSQWAPAASWTDGRKPKSQASSTIARRSHSIHDTGLTEEAGMLVTSMRKPTTDSHHDVFTGHMGDALALYVMDYNHGHGHGSSTAGAVAPQSSTGQVPKPVSQSRFRVLPDGSIVDYGLSFSDVEHAPRTSSSTAAAAAVTQPRSSFTSEAQRVSSQLYGKGTEIRPTQNSIDTSSVLRGQRIAQLSTSSGHMVSPTISHISPTRDYVGGFQVDDILSNIADDPGRRRGVTVDDRNSYSKAPFYTSVERQHTNMIGPTANTRMRTIFISTPPSTTPSTTPPTTTTTPSTTTTSTTTQKPTTTEDPYWLRQGGVPINITYVNDNQVCPKSRARWQDYTVYLETKPRLCMIQVTFNARYKQEPIYHDTWWGNSVEWVYRTVYDPEVKMVDLHGWQGSTWNG